MSTTVLLQTLALQKNARRKDGQDACAFRVAVCTGVGPIRSWVSVLTRLTFASAIRASALCLSASLSPSGLCSRPEPACEHGRPLACPRGRKPRMSTSIIQQTLALLNDAQGKTGRMPVLSVKLILKLDHFEVIACLDEGVNGIETDIGIRHVEFSKGRLFAQCQKALVGQLCAGDIQFDQVFHRE